LISLSGAISVGNDDLQDDRLLLYTRRVTLLMKTPKNIFRDPGGHEGPKINMTDVFGRTEFPVPTPNYASDPSWAHL
jgi:hypothetical protein